MNIKIWVLDLGDADCCFVLLKKNDRKFFMVIDCGKPKHSQKIIDEIKVIFDNENIEHIDVLLLTHFDNDHVGGMKEVCTAFGSQIRELWVNGISETIKKPEKKKEYKSDSIMPSESDDLVGSMVFNAEDEKNKILIQTIEQEEALISEAKGLKIPIKKTVANSLPVPIFPEIQILGPTQEYLIKLYPQINDLNDFFVVETVTESIRELIPSDPFIYLDSIIKSNVTPVNLASVIILITIDDKKFLFSGDAGIKSFMEIPDYKEQLKGVYWLKVPHHGSINNINSDLIKLFSPSYAYISGKKYFSEVVAKCFTHIGSEVKVTSVLNENLYFEYP